MKSKSEYLGNFYMRIKAFDRLNQLNQLDILNKDANLWGKISDSEETQGHQYGQNAYKVAGFPNPNYFLALRLILRP